MRCYRSKSSRGWLCFNCCLLSTLLVFFIVYWNGSHKDRTSGYRLVVQDGRNAADSLHLNSTGGGGVIPKILHQVFTTERVYENYRSYIGSCLSLNPDWEYYLWTDEDAERLIADRYPQFLARYRKYTDNLEKSDAIRYIILHHLGGIYLDMDVECVKPFFPALAGMQAFIDQERTEQTSIHFLKPYSAMNSAMGARPGHPFFWHVISVLQDIGWVGDALRTTGPMVLTKAYESYSTSQPENPPVTLLDPKVFSPLMVGMDKWKRRCQLPLAQAKGKPANSLSLQHRGCLQLEAKQWLADERDSSTVGVHAFLHLGYSWLGASQRRGLFSVPAAFPGRVKFYDRNATDRTAT